MAPAPLPAGAICGDAAGHGADTCITCTSIRGDIAPGSASAASGITPATTFACSSAKRELGDQMEQTAVVTQIEDLAANRVARTREIVAHPPTSSYQAAPAVDLSGEAAG
jgi:hypothetical protein